MEFKKIGGAWFPKETVEIRAHCVVAEPFYDRNSKKYLNIGLHENTVKLVEKIHQDSNKYLKTKHVVPVLFDNVLKVKVPWRYNRVMCKVEGSKGIQSLQKGDIVTANIQFCGVWTSPNDYSGVSWKLTEISSRES